MLVWNRLAGMAVALLVMATAAPSSQAGWWHRCHTGAIHGQMHFAPAAPMNYVPAAPMQYMPAAPMQYVPAAPAAAFYGYSSMGYTGTAAPQQFGLEDVSTIIDLVKRIRGELGGLGASGDGGSDSSRWSTLSARIDRLDTKVSDVEKGVADVTASQQEIANQVDAELRRLKDEDARLEKLIQSGGGGNDQASAADAVLLADLRELNKSISALESQATRLATTIEDLSKAEPKTTTINRMIGRSTKRLDALQEQLDAQKEQQIEKQKQLDELVQPE